MPHDLYHPAIRELPQVHMSRIFPPTQQGHKSPSSLWSIGLSIVSLTFLYHSEASILCIPFQGSETETDFALSVRISILFYFFCSHYLKYRACMADSFRIRSKSDVHKPVGTILSISPHWLLADWKAEVQAHQPLAHQSQHHSYRIPLRLLNTSASAPTPKTHDDPKAISKRL